MRRFLLAVAVAAAAACLLPGLPAHALTVTQTQAMGFGSFVGGPTGGRVSVNVSGFRAASGVVLMRTGKDESSAQPAIFSISGGRPGAVCQVGLPGNNIAWLEHQGSPMAMGDFVARTSSGTAFGPPGGSLALNALGTGSVVVGATLSVHARVTPGPYSAQNFSVTVDCP